MKNAKNMYDSLEHISSKIQNILMDEQALAPIDLVNVLDYPRVCEIYDLLFGILRSLVEKSYAEMSGMRE
jgi:ligand-binding sensor protein